MIKTTNYIKREQDYAIRIAAFLGSKYPDGYYSISEISRLLFITHPVATKVIYKLTKQGVLKTLRGRNGGIALNQNPATLSFYDILTAVGFNSSMNDCIINPGICPLVKMCKVHLYFLNIEKNIIQSLKETFLSSFIFGKEDLVSIYRDGLTENEHKSMIST